MKGFSVNSIALGNLRQHKKQYITLIFGVVLALFFSSSVLLFRHSMQVSEQNIKNDQYGLADRIYLNASSEDFEQLNENGYFSEMGKASILEYLCSTDTNIEDALKGYDGFGVSAAVMDETALKLANWSVNGKLPEKAGEIAIERPMLERLGYETASVGDTITVSALIPTGKQADSDNAFLSEPVEKSYTLVGILSNHYDFITNACGYSTLAYSDFPSAVLSKQEQVTPGCQPILDYYVTLSTGYRAKINLPTYTIENEEPALIRAHFDKATEAAITNNASTIGNSISLIGIVLILASCFGIINAFSSNLQQRLRQIGLLRAVGATKRQIRQMFGRETIWIALLSIPPSVLLSCLMVWFLMRCMGPNYHFAWSFPILIGTVVLGLLCIMAASFFPLWTASRIPPMQAIRDVGMSRRLKRRRIHSKKSFDVSKLLANRNLSLHRGRQIRIIALMTASMFLVTYLIYFDTFRIDSLTGNSGYDSDFYIMGDQNYSIYGGLSVNVDVDAGMTEHDLQDILQLDDVASVAALKQININVIPQEITNYLSVWGANYTYLARNFEPTINLPYLSDPDVAAPLEKNIYQQYVDVGKKYGYTSEYYGSTFYALDDATLKNLSDHLIDGEINLDKLASGEEVLVYAPSYIGVIKDPSSNDTYYTEIYAKDDKEKAQQQCGDKLVEDDMFHVGDKLTLSRLYTTEDLEYDGYTAVSLPNAQRIDREVTIGGIIDVDSTFYSAGSIITSVAGLDALGYKANYQEFRVKLSESPSASMEKYLEESLEQIASKTPNTVVQNLLEMTRSDRVSAFASAASGLALLILVFSICSWMIGNTFSAQIQSGKSYIGTLRAAGASEMDVSKNYYYQLIFLFLRGGIIGIPLSYLAVFAVIFFNRYILHYSNQWEVLGNPPLLPAVLLLLAMFLVCLVTVRAQLKKVLRRSIVQNIREL